MIEYRYWNHGTTRAGICWFTSLQVQVYLRVGLALTGLTLLAAVVSVAGLVPAPFLLESVLLDGPSTFLALAAVGFMKLIPPFCVGREVFGSVLVPRARPTVRLEIVPGVVTPPVRRDPFRDIPLLLVTELRDALELDRLKFSLELVARPFTPTELVFVTGVRTELFRLLLELSREALEGRDVIVLLPERAERRTDLGDSLPDVDLFRDLVEELILDRLPPFRFVIGLRSWLENKV